MAKTRKIRLSNKAYTEYYDRVRRKEQDNKIVHDFDKVFYTALPEWTAAQKIIKNACNIGSKHKGYHQHHIYPRCFSTYYNESIDDSKENLVSLSHADHIMIHYYYMFCTKDPILTAKMQYAFKSLVKDWIKKYTIYNDKEYDVKRYVDFITYNELQTLLQMPETVKIPKKITIVDKKVSGFNPFNTNYDVDRSFIWDDAWGKQENWTSKPKVAKRKIQF